MNMSARHILAGSALVLAVCSLFIISYPVIQAAVVLLAVALLI